MLALKDKTLSICASPSISSLDHPLVRAFEHQSIGDHQGPCKKKDPMMYYFSRAIISFDLRFPPRGGCTSLLAGALTFRKTGWMRMKTTMIAIRGGAAANPYTPKKKNKTMMG